MRVSSWGRLSHYEHDVKILRPPMVLSRVGQKTALPHGMGRSYGDVCLNPGQTLWFTQAMDHFIDFDEATGTLTCEAGVLLKTIQSMMVPRGWMLPVTPGTQWVTVGGAIANDVHGKNHAHRGSFGHTVLRFSLYRSDGERLECSPSVNPQWFYATIGGMGLTGLIVTATIQLRRVPGPWLEKEQFAFNDLSVFFEYERQSQREWEYTVAWLDCLKKKNYRGIFMRARHTDQYQSRVLSETANRFLFTPPISLVRPSSLRLFNQIYFHVHSRKNRAELIHYEAFFYPLDKILEWNRMYGPRGFYQYQCVLPKQDAPAVLVELLNEISNHRAGSFLSVLKTFGGCSSLGMMGFVMADGLTLALDFPNRGRETLRLFDRLDAIVLEAKGRLYCAKNAYMSQSLFESGYASLNVFQSFRDMGIRSGLSCRLMGG